MYSKLLDRIGKNVVTRLTLWYAIVFIISFLILFSIAYYFLYTSIKHLEKQDIMIEHNELRIKLEDGGLPALEEELEFEHQVAGKNIFFVRLTNLQNDIVFLNIPDASAVSDFEELEMIKLNENEQWIHLPGDRDLHDWDILSRFLSNGYLLQVGKSTETQLSFLNRFFWIFIAFMSFVVVIGILGGIVLANRAVKPARELRKTLKSILENNDLEKRVPIGTTEDEFNELVRMFNTMLDKNEYLILGLRNSLENIAHDLRTPITRLMGTADIALDSTEHITPNTKEALNDCIRESQLIITILNTLLEISAAETRVLELKLEKLNISVLIKEVVELYNFVAEGKNITITTNVPDNLAVITDINKIRQALSNLLDNSIKYTDQGGSVEIEAYGGVDDISIIIKDSGSGIPPEEIHKIWERLYRGDKSRSQKGHGLGLSLVKAIIEALNGKINVSSEPGKGSVFTIKLPK